MAEPADELPCLYCGAWYEFLSGGHFKRQDHFGDRPDAFEKYKAWVGETHDVESDDPILTTPSELTTPAGWQKNRDRFPNWRSKTEL